MQEQTMQNEGKKTPQDLLGMIISSRHKEEPELDITKLRYVIYARKSTEDETRQVRSIQDQIKDCADVARLRHLKVIGNPIIEMKSAKEADLRPKFTQMIQDIQENKYDAILSWHPDRLARNMREAGTIIDLLDKHIIKDLQFHSASFENSANGKMLLGITFVLSKHYSDHLSDNVNRGNRRSVGEGKYVNKLKHGYYKDNNQLLRPDTTPHNNFLLIQKAWEMRTESESLKEIANYLNTNHYQDALGIGLKGHKPTKMNDKKLSKMFQDPVYAGILDFGVVAPINLIEQYDFEPMISVDQYLKINNMKGLAGIKGKNKGAVKADLLRGMVFCNHCKKPMSTGITKKTNGKNYFFFRCETFGCNFKNKSTRAKVVTDYVIEYLENNKFTIQKSYKEYQKEAENLSKTKEKELSSQKQSLQNRLNNTKESISLTKNFLLQPEHDVSTKKTFEDDLRRYIGETETIKEQIENIDKQKEQNKEAILEEPIFLELFDSLPQILRENRELDYQNYIIQKIFLNFYIDMSEGTGIKSKIDHFGLNKPFDILLKNEKFLSGRGEKTRTSDLRVPNAAR